MIYWKDVIVTETFRMKDRCGVCIPFLHGGDLSMRIFAERCQNIEKILKKYRKVIYFFLQFA